MLNMLIKWVFYALVIIFTAWAVPGISVEGFVSAMIVAVVLGLINTFIKPVLKLITLPINILTLGLFSLVLNALLLMLAGYVSPGFHVEGFWSAFFGSIVIAVLSLVVDKIGSKG